MLDIERGSDDGREGCNGSRIGCENEAEGEGGLYVRKLRMEVMGRSRPYAKITTTDRTDQSHVA